METDKSLSEEEKQKNKDVKGKNSTEPAYYLIHSKRKFEKAGTAWTNLIDNRTSIA